MNPQDIASRHKTSKTDSYWNNLVGGNTAAYKEKVIEHLLKNFGPLEVKNVLDIGCGTSEVIFHYKNIYGAASATCMDYDAKVIDHLKAKYPLPDVNWVVQDVFALKETAAQFDLIFLLDMIHEVYSFYGRPGRDISLPIDHALGTRFVEDLLDNVASVTRPGGCIIITDNVVCEENVPLSVRLKSTEVAEAVAFFLKNYPTKKINCRFIAKDQVEINSRDFCILLTQYNKVKKADWARWNVERLETHQYFTLKEYEDSFSRRGFSVHSVVGTPLDAAQEWNEDFEILGGMEKLPAKRVTLLAKKPMG